MASTNEATSEANRLYWETELSVAEIAERLELSRRALYDAIVPFVVADVACEICGGEMVYENRSARAAGTAVCLRCRDRDDAGPETSEALPEVDDDRAVSARTLRVGGVMLAGAVLGAAATFLVVRRD